METINVVFRYALTDVEKADRMIRGTLLDNALPDERERLKRVHVRLVTWTKKGVGSHGNHEP